MQRFLFAIFVGFLSVTGLSQVPDVYPTVPPPAEGAIRIATFNAAMNRKNAGELTRAIESGDRQIRDIASIIQCVAPDVLLLNEVDYDESHADALLKKFLQIPQQGTPSDSSRYLRHAFSAPVNTGTPSGLDLNANGRLGEPDDAWGYGAFPGQYGMLVLSRFPLDSKGIRTFQKFLWSEMPGAMRPSKDGTYFHSDSVWNQLRLSSKSHWDIPVQIGNRTLHVLASHPTPPVFDGPEDRNGCRNHDEIRLWIDYISSDGSGDYLVDDLGTRGGVGGDAPFVILGDLNADPNDGDGRREIIEKLIRHPRVAKGPIPSSVGSLEASQKSGQANERHRGDPAYDTGDFNDKNPGNLRIDYVFPSSECRIVASGVYWPASEESPAGNRLVQASDHRLVWVDVELP
jgi:endonuclease/exonuclease/phosphatase family metal-dependent hydrolase